MSVSIRQLNEYDHIQYRQLRLEALLNHPEAFSSSYEEEVIEDASFFIRRLNQQHAYCLGAFDQEVMVGMAVFVPQERVKIHHMGDIFSVYVSPTYRKMNIGYLMIQNIIAYTKNLGYIEQIKLSVTSTNVDAIHLYQRCGFEIYGLDPNVIKINDTYYDSSLMIFYLKKAL